MAEGRAKYEGDWGVTTRRTSGTFMGNGNGEGDWGSREDAMDDVIGRRGMARR